MYTCLIFGRVFIYCLVDAIENLLRHFSMLLKNAVEMLAELFFVLSNLRHGR